ncbi:hypothetical protein BV22DRAFT_1135670 [Leucogyrophana mollusca]|uniref:Uncharacterized protein n=1 Tax=Leucogyrophana mollusca TaxID=85980 RepID=A0ACB8AX29_9AGAM|nr:hypothetical protein BV22DRAFT_1135670 [Leucogyrophana mollusca]
MFSLPNTFALCWILHRSWTEFARTDTLIDKLVIYTVNTGLLTSLFTLADLLCAITMQDNLIYIGLYFCLSKLYTNAFQAILNSRHGLAHMNDEGSFDLGPIDNHILHEPLANVHRRTPYAFETELSHDTHEDASEGAVDIKGI